MLASTTGPCILFPSNHTQVQVVPPMTLCTLDHPFPKPLKHPAGTVRMDEG